MSLDESRRVLKVSESDMSSIRQAKDPNWFTRAVVTIIVFLTSFAVGFLLGRTYSSTGAYPYAAAIPSLAHSSKTRIPWLFVAVLAILSFFSLTIGVFAAEPNIGVVTYYGSYSRKG